MSDDLRATWQRTDDLLRKLHVTPGAVVADLGAGDGYFTAPLQAHLGATGVLHSIDLHNGTATLPDACLDAALLVSVLGVARDLPTLLQELVRLLKPRARVVVCDQELNVHQLVTLLCGVGLEVLEADPRFIDTGIRRRPLVVVRKPRERKAAS